MLTSLKEKFEIIHELHFCYFISAINKAVSFHFTLQITTVNFVPVSLISKSEYRFSTRVALFIKSSPFQPSFPVSEFKDSQNRWPPSITPGLKVPQNYVVLWVTILLFPSLKIFDDQIKFFFVAILSFTCQILAPHYLNLLFKISSENRFFILILLLICRGSLR